MNFCRLTIQEPIFSVSNTEFEGGDDGHGHGDHTFLVKQAQPSHIPIKHTLDWTYMLIIGCLAPTALATGSEILLEF
jgi:hypothetical protein